MTDSQRKIVDALRAHPASTARDLASHTGLGYSTITALLRGALTDAGHVRRDANTWTVCDPAPSATTDGSLTPSTSDSRDASQTDTPDRVNENDDDPPAAAGTDPVAAEETRNTQAQGEGLDHADAASADTAPTDHTSLAASAPTADTGQARATGPDDTPAIASKRPYRKSGLAPLGKGVLQHHILAVMRADPHAQWKVTPLARHLTGVLGRKASTGAIKQACHTLAARGELIQTVEEPATFKAL